MSLQLPADTIGLVVVNFTVSRDTENQSFGWYDTVVDKKNGDYYQLVDVGIDMHNKKIEAFIFEDGNLPKDPDHLGTPLASEAFDLEDPVPGLAGIFAKIGMYFVHQNKNVDNYAIKYHGHGGVDGIFGYNTEEGSSGLILGSSLDNTSDCTMYRFLDQVCHGVPGTDFPGVGTLAFLDFSTPCETSGLANYFTAREHATFFIASDLSRGDSGGAGVEPTTHYHTYWTKLQESQDAGVVPDIFACLSDFMKAWKTYLNPPKKAAVAVPNRIIFAMPGKLGPSDGQTIVESLHDYEAKYLAGLRKESGPWWDAWEAAPGYAANALDFLLFLKAFNKEEAGKYDGLIETIEGLYLPQLTATNKRDVDWKYFQDEKGWKNIVDASGVLCQVIF